MHDPSAVNVDRLPRDGGRAVGGEEQDVGGNLLGRLPAAEGAHLADLGQAPFVVSELLIHRLLVIPRLPHAAIERCLDHAGANRVYADAIGGEILGRNHREVDECRFSSAVRRIGWRADLPGDRRNERHGAAFVFDKRGRERLRDMHRAEQIDLINAIPIARLQVPKRKAELSRAHAGGIDDMVSGTKFARHAQGRRLDRTKVDHIDTDPQMDIRAFTHASRHTLRLLAAVNDRHAAPLAGEFLGNRQPNPTSPAHNNRDLILQVKLQGNSLHELDCVSGLPSEILLDAAPINGIDQQTKPAEAAAIEVKDETGEMGNVRLVFFDWEGLTLLNLAVG